MNKNLLMLCFKACYDGDTRVTPSGRMESTWTFAAARAMQLKNAIDAVPDEPIRALTKYFRAKDCLLNDFSVVANIFEETNAFEVEYDELKEQVTIKLIHENDEMIVVASDHGFFFTKNGIGVRKVEYEETMNLDRIIDIITPFFVEIE